MKIGDYLKWAAVVLLFVLAVIGNIHFAHLSSYWRLLAALGLLVIMIFLAVQTEKGRQAWQYLHGAYDEVRRVVWPTRQVVLQTTLVVAAMVAIAAAIIFLLDQV